MLADLARTTFYDAFAATNDATDMALHLQRAYGVPQQTAEFQDPRITTLLVEQDGVAIAYAQIRDHHMPDCVSGPAPIELWRFYVDRDWHGRGIAPALMDRVKAEARRAWRAHVVAGRVGAQRPRAGVLCEMWFRRRRANTYSCSAPIRRRIGS